MVTSPPASPTLAHRCDFPSRDASTRDRCPRPATARQLEVLRFIRDYGRQYGRPATYREIMAAHGFGLGAATDHAKALRRKGLLAWSPGSSRTLVVTDEGLAVLSAASIFFIFERSESTDRRQA